MRKLLVIVFTLSTLSAISQTTKKDKPNLADRAADHLMLQISSDHWTGVPDSISSHIGGLSRGANIYFMMDKPFRGNPKLSVAFGAGFGTSHIFFKRMQVQIESTGKILPFIATDTTATFKKYKLATAFFEIPLELRFSSNPENPNRSVKAAIGVKGGLLLNAHTKGKTLRTASGTVLNSYTEKNQAKTFFNTTRLALTARVGYGIFSLFTAYNISSMFKDGVAADMKSYQIGLTISGL